ncbi:hypothetical protein BDW75DRAFT_231301 [Aspergillus navahoensis]
MPFLYNLLDRFSDTVIAVVSPGKRDRNRDHDREPSSIPAPKLHRRRREGDYDDSDDDYEPLSYYSRRLSKQTDESEASFSGEGGRPGPGYSNGSSSSECVRYYRTPRHGKSVHWGGITDDFPDGVPEASAPGLSEFAQRRTSRNPNYVYGADESVERQSPSRSPRGTRMGSLSLSGSGSESRSESRSESPKPPGSYEEAGGQEQPSVSWSPLASRSPPSIPGRRQLVHRTHVPRKSVLKTPTMLDDEMLIRNLWAMVNISESRLDYAYEFLAGVLLVGDEVLDTMWGRAKRMQERERRRAARPTNIPVSRKSGSSREVPEHVRNERREKKPPVSEMKGLSKEMDILEEE